MSPLLSLRSVPALFRQMTTKPSPLKHYEKVAWRLYQAAELIGDSDLKVEIMAIRRKVIDDYWLSLDDPALQS